MNRIILFDMDGTLTEPREEITDDMLEALLELSEEAEIGIVTGSDLNYIKEQISTFAYQSGDWGLMFDLESDEPVIKHILPCNGTKYYVYDSHELDFYLKNSNLMEVHLGREKFNLIVEKLLELQLDIVKQYSTMPLTGRFIDYRESMINWCPIGRNAKEQERNKFITLENKYNIREKYVTKIKEFIKTNIIDVDIALGGQTSFDIYPTDWDKSYALNYFYGCDVYFVGDKCFKGGNDFAIYNKLGANKRFKVSSPEDTIELIYDVLIPKLKSDD